VTYAELAAARGISKVSAERLVRRRKWRRQADNQGVIRIFVPSVAMSEADVCPDIRPDVPHDIRPDMSAAISAFNDAVTALRERAEHDRTDLERVRQQCAEADARADRAEAALTAEQAARAATTVRAEIAERRRRRRRRQHYDRPIRSGGPAVWWRDSWRRSEASSDVVAGKHQSVFCCSM
jgi:hypothetical protein